MATEIGTVNKLIGTAEAISADGSKRPLVDGGKLFAGEVVSTGVGSAISIEFTDGSFMDLGQQSQAVLDSEVFDPQQAIQTEAEIQDDVDALQQALLDGADPTQDAEATAAGAGPENGNEGTNIVQVLHDGQVVTPTSGFETTGVNVVFDEGIDEDGIDDSPTAGITTVLLDDDVPVATDDNDATMNEDTRVTINVLGNDASGADGASITGITEPANGSVVLNSDSTFTYTPSANFSGADSFTYTLTDGDGDTSTATVSIQVDAVADEPNLIMSVGQAVRLDTPQTIDISNVATTNNGFSISSYDIEGNLLQSGISTVVGTGHEGFGVSGKASGADTEIGSNKNSSERLSVQFDNTVNSIEVEFAWINTRETAEYTFYLNGSQVGDTKLFGDESGHNTTDKIDGPFVLSLGEGEMFDRVDFTAPLNMTDDYLIHSITFDRVASYTYELNISAGLTDVDGSESLGEVLIPVSSLPTGTILQDLGGDELSPVDGNYVIDATADSISVQLVSNSDLSYTDLNGITGSATSTDGSDVTTTVTNVKIETSDLNSNGEIADLFLEGDNSVNTIIGGEGDDVIFGGTGNDELTGGLGADTFIWTKGDVDSGVDTITDFNAGEDVLNLADLLSDGSHTIEGIENTTTGSSHLQLDIKDSGGSVVQSIDLTDVAIVSTVEDTLQSLLSSGAINDGI